MLSTREIRLPLPGRNFEGAGVGILDNSTKWPHGIDGGAEERLVKTNSAARAGRLFRSRKAAPIRPASREIGESEVACHVVELIGAGEACYEGQCGKTSCASSPTGATSFIDESTWYAFAIN